MSECTKGEWKAGFNPGVTGPTTPSSTPVCGGRSWPYRTINVGTETIAICPAQDPDRDHKPNEGEMMANAHLIITAVNACKKVNPDDPLAVAKSIPSLCEACKKLSDILGDIELDDDELQSKRSEVMTQALEVVAEAEGR